MSIYVDIEKTAGDFHLKVQFETGDDTLALLGASGSGKSMTLRCIAGIERPDRGRILVNGVTLFDSEKRIDLPPRQRRTGLLFQEYALFPHMTVRQNIDAGARREPDRKKRERAVSEMLDRFGLTALAGQYPRALSGGERQRTALARMLVSSPGIVLLDEPFSALDSHLRFQLEQEVHAAMRAFGGTVILVSHDREEVYRMADRIAVVENGAIAEIGEKNRIFAAPATRAGARLTGCRNLSAVGERHGALVTASDWGIELHVPALRDDTTALGIRAEQIRPGSSENSFRCRIVREIEEPLTRTLLLRPVGAATGTPIAWTLPKESWPAIRANEIEICLPPEALLPLRGC